jgi:hypothetical protein
MVRQVLERMPDYEIDQAGSRRYDRIGTVNGWTTMPACFSPSLG